MTTSKNMSRWLARLLILTMICLSMAACSKPSEGNESPPEPTTPTSEDPVEEGQAEEEQGEKEQVEVTDPFFAEFDAQVIYDKEGITVTAEPSDGKESGTILVYPGAIFTLRIKNNTDKSLRAIVDSVETPDGLALQAWGYWGTSAMSPGNEYEMTVSFSAFDSREQPAICRFFKDHGLGEKIGDFRVNFVMYDDDTGKSVHNIRTDFVKISLPDFVPDYSQVLRKPPLVDEAGMKLYHVDSFITPEREVPFWGTIEEMVNVLIFVENNTDEVVDASYMNDTWEEGKEYIFYDQSGPKLAPKTKAFKLISQKTSEIKEAGIDRPTVYQFKWFIMEYLPDDSRNNILETELITIPLPNPIPEKDYLILR